MRPIVKILVFETIDGLGDRLVATLLEDMETWANHRKSVHEVVENHRKLREGSGLKVQAIVFEPT